MIKKKQMSTIPEAIEESIGSP